MGGYSGVNFGHSKSEVFQNVGGGYSGLQFQKGVNWRIWTKIYCSARNLLVHHSSLSHTTYVETNEWAGHELSFSFKDLFLCRVSENNIINRMVLVLKMYLFKCKCLVWLPTKIGFLQSIRSLEMIERWIAKKEFKLTKHKRMWTKLINVSNNSLTQSGAMMPRYWGDDSLGWMPALVTGKILRYRWWVEARGQTVLRPECWIWKNRRKKKNCIFQSINMTNPTCNVVSTLSEDGLIKYDCLVTSFNFKK